jgi:hypothetical protein
MPPHVHVRNARARRRRCAATSIVHDDDGADTRRELVEMADQFPTSQAPVEHGQIRRQALPPGVALCLSGGGYQAMLFHLGG